jgi:ComF family protein
VGNRCQPKSGAPVDKWCRWLETRLWPSLWPSTCVLCGQDGQAGVDLCAPCAADLPANTVACRTCAQPLYSEHSSAALICGACLQRPVPFDASIAPFRYAYPVDRTIQALKFRHDLACGRVLGELLARRLIDGRAAPMPEAIIPVPLATQRYRERGFNQAHELARAVSHATGIPIRADIVIRNRETLEQTALDQKARRRNVRRAFTLVAPLPGSHVAIIDDVVTTGSTVTELAQTLRRAGASRIQVWAVARAGKNRSEAVVGQS